MSGKIDTPFSFSVSLFIQMKKKIFVLHGSSPLLFACVLCFSVLRRFFFFSRYLSHANDTLRNPFPLSLSSLSPRVTFMAHSLLFFHFASSQKGEILRAPRSICGWRKSPFLELHAVSCPAVIDA